MSDSLTTTTNSTEKTSVSFLEAMATDSTNNGQIILAVPAPQASNTQVDHFKKVFPDSAISTLSSLQITCAFLAIITQIILFAVSYRHEYVSVVGTGIWTGFFFAVSGSIGFLSKARPSTCSFSAFMVLSIISCLLCLPLLVFGGIGIGDDYHSTPIRSVLYGFQILVALTQAVVCITTSAFCCRAVCCCGKSSNPGQVYYVPSNDQNLQRVVTVQAESDPNPPDYESAATKNDDYNRFF